MTLNKEEEENVDPNDWKILDKNSITKILSIINSYDYNPFFRLFVSGNLLFVKYENSDNEKVFKLLENGSIAWLEEQDKKTHYYVFKIGDQMFLLSAIYRGNKGISVDLVEVLDKRLIGLQALTLSELKTEVRKVGKWGKDINRIGGNNSVLVTEYSNILKGNITILVDVGFYSGEKEKAKYNDPIVITPDNLEGDEDYEDITKNDNNEDDNIE
jgi:hypothetical protein